MPQASVAVTVKVLVSAQAEPLVTEVTLIVAVPQAAVALTPAVTLATVGRLAGLQPRLPPGGTVTVGALVSTVQV